MSVDISRGGLLVALAIFDVIIYEPRTVLDFVGVEIPLTSYTTAVIVLAGATRSDGSNRCVSVQYSSLRLRSVLCLFHRIPDSRVYTFVSDPNILE